MNTRLRKWLYRLLWCYRLPAYLLLPVLIWLTAPGWVLALSIVQDLQKPMITRQLPNGMLLTLNFDLTFNGRVDLHSADGQTRLAKGVATLCFNDRYVDAPPHGLFDAGNGQRVPDAGYETAYASSGLAGRPGCNGYYTVHIRSRLLVSGRRPAEYPPCLVRNGGNPTLANAEWLSSPCVR